MDVFSTLYRFQIIPFLKKWNLLNFILGALDILAIILAFQLSYLLNPLATEPLFLFDGEYLWLFLFVTPVWLFILYLLKATEIPRTKSYRIIFFEYAVSAALILLMLILIYFLIVSTRVPRRFIFEIVGFGFLFLFILRIIEYKVFRLYRSKGYNFINVVLLADEKAIPFIESLISNDDWGYRIAAIFTQSDSVKDKYEENIIILPDEYIQVLNDLMEVDMIDEVLYVKSKENPAEIRNIIRSCEELGVTFRLMPRDEKINISSAIKSEIGNNHFLTFTNVPHNSMALAVKKVIDIFGSLLALLFFLPFILVTSVIIMISSPGPVIYKQKRVGLRGRIFELYKFRTMVKNADELKKDLQDKNIAERPAFKVKDDPRVTGVGRFLRATGLDELPQLFNILKGEMSLIGPRPPLPEEILEFKRWQLRKLSVRPGLSCFWQIKPDRNTIRMQKWMELDLAYIDNWSLRLDFLILLKTVKTVFMRSGI